MKKQKAEVAREYGPYPEASRVNGVTFDGKQLWFASGDKLIAVDPDTGAKMKALSAASHAGTAFDGKHLYQVTESKINKICPDTGAILKTIDAPGAGGDSGLTWAEGYLWVGQYRERKIHQIDPNTGAIIRSIQSDRFVTGVTWLQDELWHGTWEGDESELRHIDANSGAVLERYEMPAGTGISGLESNGKDTFFCGGGGSAKIRAIKKAKRAR